MVNLKCDNLKASSFLALNFVKFASQWQKILSIKIKRFIRILWKLHPQVCLAQRHCLAWLFETVAPRNFFFSLK